MGKSIKIEKITLLLSFLYIFHVAANIAYLKIDTTSPTWMPANHTLQAIKMFNIINSPDMSFKNDLKADIVGCEHICPPLVYLMIYPFFKIFGADTDIAVMAISIIFYLVLILSVFKIGEIISGKRSIGLLSAFLITMYPFVYASSKQFLLDFPTMTIVALSVFFLIKTDNFRNQKYSIFFGLILGLGMLIKESYTAFIVGPFLCTLPKSLRDYRDKRIIANLILSLIIGALISSIWYLPNLSDIIDYSKYFLYIGTPDFLTGSSSFRPEWIFSYIRSLIVNQTSFWFFFIFVISFYLFLKNKIRNKSIVVAWLFVNMLIFIFLRDKQIRFSMPILPAVAVISATGIGCISKPILRYLLIWILVLYSLFLFVIHSSGHYLFTQVSSKLLMNRTINEYLKGYMEYGWVSYPLKDNYNMDEIFDIVLSEMKNKDEFRKIYITISDPLFNERTLRYLAIKRGYSNIYFESLLFYENPIENLKAVNMSIPFYIIHVYPHPGVFHYKNKLLMQHFLENNERYHLLLYKDFFGRGIYIYEVY